MGKSAQLRPQDWRTILRLVNECRDLGDDPNNCRQHLASGIARLTGADMVTVGAIVGSPEGGLRQLGLAGWGLENFNTRVLVESLAVRGHDLMQAPHLAAFFRQGHHADGACLPRKALVGDREWYRSFYHECVHDPLGIEHVLTSFALLPGGSAEHSGIGAARARSARQDFRLRDAALVREAHAAVRPLIGGPLAGFAEPAPGALAPRVRQVLCCLLEGDGDKQVAKRLGISRFTVNQYTKVIFQFFGVSSRAELLARWVRRGWGSLGWREERS